MSILGTSAPKITDSAGANTVTLTYAFDVQFEPDAISREHTNIGTGIRSWDYVGDLMTFRCKYNIHKEANVSVFLSALAQHYKTEVRVYPRNDYAYQDGSGNPTLFLFSELRMEQLETYLHQDILLLRFDSVNAVDTHDSGS